MLAKSLLSSASLGKLSVSRHASVFCLAHLYCVRIIICEIPAMIISESCWISQRNRKVGFRPCLSSLARVMNSSRMTSRKLRDELSPITNQPAHISRVSDLHGLCRADTRDDLALGHTPARRGH